MSIIVAIIVGVPIYEYRCEECGKKSSLLVGFSSPDPACPHCGQPALRRLVSTFATVSSGDGDDDFGGGDDDFSGGDDDLGGGDDDF
jgi:putative FmdB family regulatory protein